MGFDLLPGAGLSADAPASGLVLITPTSIANSGGSSSASGGQVTFTGVSSISLNGVFTSAYENYLLVGNAISSNVSSYWNYRLRASGTDDTSSLYGWNIGYVQSTTVGSLGRSAAANYGALGWMTDETGALEITIYRPQASARTAISGTSYARRVTATVILPTPIFTGGEFTGTTQFDGITLYPDSGTFTGVVRVYSYQNT